MNTKKSLLGIATGLLLGSSTMQAQDQNIVGKNYISNGDGIGLSTQNPAFLALLGKVDRAKILKPDELRFGIHGTGLFTRYNSDEYGPLVEYAKHAQAIIKQFTGIKTPIEEIQQAIDPKSVSFFGGASVEREKFLINGEENRLALVVDFGTSLYKVLSYRAQATLQGEHIVGNFQGAIGLGYYYDDAAKSFDVVRRVSSLDKDVKDSSGFVDGNIFKNHGFTLNASARKLLAERLSLGLSVNLDANGIHNYANLSLYYDLVQAKSK